MQAADDAQRIAELKIPVFSVPWITGGDISPDGLRRSAVRYVDGYELVLADARAPFDQIWKQPLRPLDLGKRKQGESNRVSGRDGRALLQPAKACIRRCLSGWRR